MTATLILHTNSDLLEGPVFDNENRLLYFVSILERLVYCYNPQTKEILSMHLDSPVSCIYLIDYKVVLVASKEGFYKIDFNSLSKSLEFQIEIPDDVRFNDGIKDARGRILIGTMGYPDVVEHIGKVYSYHNGKVETIIENTTISNGLAFSADSNYLYFIDTPTKKVARYNYDIENGKVEFDRYIIEFEGSGSPDGMSICHNGYLWIAEWGGSRVSVWNPENGEKIRNYALPCKNVTSCCFDSELNLFVTTAQSEVKKDVYGGGLFYFNFQKEKEHV